MEYIDIEIFLGKINKNQDVVKKTLEKKEKILYSFMCIIYDELQDLDFLWQGSLRIFHKCKHPIDINNVDISKLLMSDKRWILDTKVMMVLDH